MTRDETKGETYNQLSHVAPHTGRISRRPQVSLAMKGMFISAQASGAGAGSLHATVKHRSGGSWEWAGRHKDLPRRG